MGSTTIYGICLDQKKQSCDLSLSLEEDGNLSISRKQYKNFVGISYNFTVRPSGYITMQKIKNDMGRTKSDPAKSIYNEGLSDGLMALFQTCAQTAEEKKWYKNDKPYMNNACADNLMDVTQKIVNIMDFRLEPYLWQGRVFKPINTAMSR